MIRINLAKASGKKKSGGSSPVFKIFLLLLLLTAGGVYYYMEYMQDGETENPIDTLLAMFMEPEEAATAAPKKAADVFDKLIESMSDSGEAAGTSAAPEKAASAPQEKIAVPEKIAPAPPPAAAVAPPPAPPPAPRAEPRPAKPSSLVRSNMVEDVVKELGSETRAVNKLNAAYDEMTVAEKINYEVLFGRNAFEMVTRCTPVGVRLRTLEIENFQTVYASGLGGSREIVQEMFASFKNERGELLPKPLSYIKDDDKGGFQFVVTFKPRFGLELSDPFQALDHLGFKESLTTHLRNFTRLAAANNFKTAAAPRQISAERAGSYRRMVYSVSGMSTYKDFHKFVLALHSEKVPCALKKLTLTPVKDEQVRVNAEILFTVKQ